MTETFTVVNHFPEVREMVKRPEGDGRKNRTEGTFYRKEHSMSYNYDLY